VAEPNRSCFMAYMDAKTTPGRKAEEIRRQLRFRGSTKHAKAVEWFLKQPIKSHGWYTADLRRLARQYQRALEKQFGFGFLIELSERLFSGRVLEEKVFAVLLLEQLTEGFDDSHFDRFESWIDRISSWADHDGLVHYLIGPMIAAHPERAGKVFDWAQSANRWRRRAACVALIQSVRQGKLLPQVTRLSNLLLNDEDDMVVKGLGWLLRETAKADPMKTLPYLLRIRSRAPRLVLRTACETLAPELRGAVLGSKSVGKLTTRRASRPEKIARRSN
jgi:3-methyladenine DNA glycosylase AlkD